MTQEVFIEVSAKGSSKQTSERHTGGSRNPPCPETLIMSRERGGSCHQHHRLSAAAFANSSRFEQPYLEDPFQFQYIDDETNSEGAKKRLKVPCEVFQAAHCLS